MPGFAGARNEDVVKWLDSIEEICQRRPIARTEWVNVAFRGLGENVQTVMETIEDDLDTLCREKWTWTWTTFKQAMVGIDKQVKESRSTWEKVNDFRRENPRAVTAAGLGLVGIAAIPLAPALLVGGLNLLGFSAVGPVAGSIAAGAQSAIYGGAVASGSAFALAQSAAMGGVAVAGAGGLVSGAGAAAAGTWLQFSKPKDLPPNAWPRTLKASSDLLLSLMLEQRKQKQ